MTAPQDPDFPSPFSSDPQVPGNVPGAWPGPSYGSPPPPSVPPGPGGYYPYPPMMAANPFDSRATPVLVFGILGLVFCQLCAPVAWIMGNGVKRDAEASGFPEPGLGKAGRICGIVGSVLLIAMVGFFVLFIALGAGTASTR